MTDETRTPPVADADAAAKRAALEAEATRLQIKFDKRFSDKRLADMITEKSGEPVMQAAVTQPATAVVDSPPTSELDALKAMVAQMAAQNAKLIEQLSAQAAAPVPAVDPLYKVPVGTRTLVATVDDAERAALMEQCVRLGIQNVVPAKAGNDWIREHITRHLAAKAQEQAILEAQAAEAASRPPERLVDIRILPKGDKKLSRGVHIPGSGDLKYNRGEIVKGVPYPIAVEHQDVNGYVEILDAVAA